MSAELRALGLGEGQVLGWLLVLARVSPLFALAPLFSSRMLPVRARALCAVGLAFGLAPVVAQRPRLPGDVLDLTLAMSGEILVGLAFAFVVSILFSAVAAAGSLLDTLIGFSFSALVDPVTGSQSSVLQNMYGLVAVLVLIAIGGDRWIVEGLARTYDLVPLAHAPSLPGLTAGAADAFAGLFLSALQVAGPVMLALVLADAALGIVTRAVPQLNVLSVAFPAKIVVGLVVVAASLSFAGGWIADGVQGSVTDALRTVR